MPKQQAVASPSPKSVVKVAPDAEAPGSGFTQFKVSHKRLLILSLEYVFVHFVCRMNIKGCTSYNFSFFDLNCTG